MTFDIDVKWLVFPTNDKIAYCKWNKLNKSLPLDTESYGIRCGKTSGICVVDIDNKLGGLLFEKDLINNHIEYGCVETPRGYHFYFSINTFEFDIRNGSYIDTRYGRLDIRNNEKGYVIGPGSKTKNGTYTWKNKCDSPDHFSKVKFLLSDLSKNIPQKRSENIKIERPKVVEFINEKDKLTRLDKLLYFLGLKNEKIPASYFKGFKYYICSKIGFDIGEGHRNNTLFKIASCICHKYAWFVEYLDTILYFLNSTLFKKPLEDKEVLSIFKYIWRSIVETPNTKKRIFNKLLGILTTLYNSLFNFVYKIRKFFDIKCTYKTFLLDDNCERLVLEGFG